MPKTHACDLCGQQFTRKTSLTRHTRNSSCHKLRSTPQSGGKECIYCQRRFASRGALHSHHQSVHGEKPRPQCPTCGLHFTRKESLTRHINQHCHPPTPPVRQAAPSHKVQIPEGEVEVFHIERRNFKVDRALDGGSAFTLPFCKSTMKKVRKEAKLQLVQACKDNPGADNLPIRAHDDKTLASHKKYYPVMCAWDGREFPDSLMFLDC